MGGYTGKVLRINLTERKISIEALNMELAKNYLSGRGLAGKMFYDEVAAEVDALSPENTIYIASGVLTGTNAPTSGRFTVVTKSPLTGCITSSNSGGYWGAQLKYAGYDMVILEGKAAKPVYITIIDDKVEIKEAAKLWGKDVYATIETIKLELGDDKAKVLTIGPAGEILFLNAAIMNDLHRAAGCSGVGAVMGSKNLKAIVVRGTGKVVNANPNEISKILSAALGNDIDSYDPDKVSEETNAVNHLIKKHACYRCPVACGRYSKEKGGKKAGPEQEAIQATNELCDKLGMDSIWAGRTIATAIELLQRGYIKPEELDGIPLEFGDVKGVVEWTRKMAYGEGFGAKLAQGSYRLAEAYGHSELSTTVKNPRYVTNNRGGRHVRGYMVSPEILEEETTWVKIFQELTAVIDSVGMCLFTSCALGLSDYTAIVNAVTGSNYTDVELLACGERIWNIERLQNLEFAKNVTEDRLPSPQHDHDTKRTRK